MQASHLSPPSLPPHTPLPEHSRPFPLLEHPAPIFQKCPLKLLPSSIPQICAPPFAHHELLFPLATGIANLGEPRRLAPWGRASCQILSLALRRATGTLPLLLLIGMLVRPTGGIKALRSTEQSSRAGIGETKTPQPGEEGDQE